jgi:DNA transposition AAA+ family ATPase
MNRAYSEPPERDLDLGSPAGRSALRHLAATALDETSAPASASPAFDEPLRAALQAHIEAEKLPQREIALQLGVSAAAVNKYLTRKPAGDVPRLESLIADYLKAAPERVKLKIELFDTAVSLLMHGYLENIRKTGDLAILTGPAGIGKTCAGQLWCLRNPTSVFLTIYRYSGKAVDVRRHLWDTVDTRGWSPATHASKWEYLVCKFKGSGRVLLIDNCHRLSRSAIESLFDFHDETAIPIVFLGNPMFHDTLKQLKDNDQQLSRTGIFRHINVGNPRELAAKMLDTLAPQHKAALLPLAAAVAGQRGHGRSLRKQLNLTRELQAGGLADVAEAFRAAHTLMLNRDYPLEAE